MFRPRFLLFLALLSSLATLPRIAYCQTSDGITGWEPKALAVEVARPMSLSRSPMPDTDIYIIDSLGSKPRWLVEGKAPTFSPDGKQITYCVRVGAAGFELGQIQVINADGSGYRQLTHVKDPACEPQWSPDGEKIAFTAFKGKTSEIYIIDRNGNNATPIIDGSDAHWSPDGRQIVFVRHPDGHNSNGSIWIANADGTEAKKVIEDSSFALQPAWYPDGKSIVFTSARDHTSAIFRVNLDGSNLEKIARAEKFAFYFPVLSPDGRQLIVSAYDEANHRSPILLLNAASTEGKTLTFGSNPSVYWEKKH
jgi:Tol biopolymer transport system component